MTPLPTAFFTRSALDVARELIGMELVKREAGGSLLRGRIVETEAYTQDDPAFHGWGLIDRSTGLLKPAGRGLDLFGPPGTAYVYLIYGRYWLLNVVTEPEGIGGAVLLRAVEPVEGVALMRERREVARDRDLTSGPGKLTLAYDVDATFHGHDLTASPLFFAEPARPAPITIETSSRIGITRGVDHYWRYFEKDNPFVSPGTPSDIVMARKHLRKR